jgi:tripartite-type tricarboxylate transporter receptor subunit TctC
MRTPRRLLLAALAAPALARAQAPAWPQHPIRWIINFPPGGAADTLSRALCDSIGARLGQPLVPENRPGAGGLVGADLLAKARGDAHMVLMSSAASHGIGPVLYPNVPYDPLADFAHVALVGTFPSVLCVNNDFRPQHGRVHRRGEAARRHQLRLGRQRHDEPPGGPAARPRRRGGAERMCRTAAAPGADRHHGRADPAIMESLPIALPHVRAGRLRPLAASEATRAATTPEVPTFAEAGFPQAQSTNWFGFSIAAGLAPDMAARWAGIIGEALAEPRTRERFANIGVVPGQGGPAEYTALITAELARWREVIRTGNIRAD